MLTLFFFCFVPSPSRRKKEERGEASEDEEDEIKEKERLFQERRLKEKREAEAAAKAEGPTATTQTIVKHTFDTNHSAELLLVKLPNVLGITPQPFDPSTYTMDEDEKPTSAVRSSSTGGVKKEKSKEKEKEKDKRKKDKDSMDIDDDDDEDENGDKDKEGDVKLDDKTEDAQDVRVKLSVENIIRWRQKKDEAGQIIGVRQHEKR